MVYLQWERFDHDGGDNITKVETSAREGRPGFILACVVCVKNENGRKFMRKK